MDIRRYRHEDFEEAIALWDQSALLGEGRDPEIDIERNQNHHPDLFLVAEVNGRLVGTLMGGDDGYLGYAHYLAVCPEFRGRGIANALLSRLEKKLIARGCSRLRLLADEDNAAVLSMVEKAEYLVEEKICLSKLLIND